jgi:tetratricopeptide (TPR) repeat protein
MGVAPDWLKLRYRMLRGRFFFKRRRFERAHRCFQDALAIQPDHLPALAWLGTSCMSLLRYQDAIAAFDRALQIKPDFAWCHAMLGRTYCYLKEGQQSVESFNRAFRMQPTYKKSVSDLIAAASVHSQIGDDEGSLQLYRDAVALQPKNDEAQYGLGWTLLHLGKNDDAEPHLRLAMKFKPDNADAHYNLGLVSLPNSPRALGRNEFALRRVFSGASGSARKYEAPCRECTL